MQYAPLKDEILSGISKVLDGMQLFLGENVQSLEKEFSKFCGAKFGIGVCDGTAALQILLRAMDIGPGDEVITPSHTFIATAEAILLTGAKPVFVDIDPETCLMDVDPLLEIARKHNLRVIEDTCQSHGAEYKGRKAGSMGDGGAFSFYFSKNLGAYGEGGFITTNDPEIARKVRMLRDHGSGVRYHHDMIGFNGRLDEIQAVVLRAKLPHLADWNNQRRAHAERYNQLLQGLPLKTPVELAGNCHIYHLYVIQTAYRDELQAYLKERGIFTGIHYPVPIHLQRAVEFLGYKPGSLPVTEHTTSEILSLPMFAELTDEQIDYVVAGIREFMIEKVASTST
jgi:dTDP-4-amino-4,6-dideoxygalactose transaminase